MGPIKTAIRENNISGALRFWEVTIEDEAKLMGTNNTAMTTEDEALFRQTHHALAGLLELEEAER